MLDKTPTTQAETASQPASLLKGVRVLDLSNVLAGPFCTYQMALLGAEVIKVENPVGGDLARQLGAHEGMNKDYMGASFIAQNGGKKSLTLNLKTAEGKRVFKQLIATADVVVENFRPGVMDRLSVGYSVLSAIKPSLVYCAISGFGQDGVLRDRPAYDQIIQGMSGIMSITGMPSSPPLRVGFPVCDTFGGLTGAFAIVSALYSSRLTGVGCFIDVSMLDAALTSLGWAVSNYLATGVVPQALGNENVTAAPSGTFETADGQMNIAANKQEHFIALMNAIGRSELVHDSRFAARDDRKRNRKALNAEVGKSLMSRTATEWEAILAAAGIPVGPVLNIPQVLEQAQVKSRRLLQSVRYQGAKGEVATNVLTSGYRLSNGEPMVQEAPPRLGQHTDDILQSIGVDAAAIDEMRAAGVV